MSILIVDDSHTDVQIITDILAEAGYTDVLTASSAAEAFSFLNLQDYTSTAPAEIELVLMDIFMPGMDGLEACSHIKEIESLKDIPVIVVTARASDENLSLAFKKGASDYIRKPINKIELLSRIRAALRLRQEINERRKAEESLRAFEKAIENMQIGVTITDLKGNILYANPADAKMHGFEQFELPGQSVRIFSPQELWKPLTLKQLMKLKSRRRESANVKKDGTVFPVQLLSDIVTNTEGKAIGVVTTCEDITERKRSEDSLKKAREELEKRVRERTKELLDANAALNKEVAEKLTLQAETVRAAHLASLGELSAGVAHEINNPINGIINCAKILVNRCKGHEKEKEIIEMIMSEGKRIANIVQALLSFARERKEKKGPVHLDRIIADALTLTAAHMRKDGIRFTIDVPEQLPVITGHHQQIQQVFLNIINNAQYALNQKYPKEDENKSMSISAETLYIDKKRFIRITFLDKGIGIPSHVLNKAMNPFFSTKPPDKGTGLGLSISHGIIADHGGMLSIESKEGEYTRVTIDLPVGEGK